MVMACYGLTARAQVHDSKNFVYLFSDSVIHGESVRMAPDFSGYWQLRVDSRRLPLESVKFFSNDEGFFANTRRLGLGNNIIAERVVEGKVNLFREITYNALHYSEFRDYSAIRSSPMTGQTYYNKGFDNLKRTNYRNLNVDLADNVKSMDLLQAYRKKRSTGTKLYVVAGVLATIGSAFILTDPISDGYKNFTIGSILLGSSMGSAVAGYFIGESASSRLEDAVDAYNR